MHSWMPQNPSAVSNRPKLRMVSSHVGDCACCSLSDIDDDDDPLLNAAPPPKAAEDFIGKSHHISQMPQRLVAAVPAGGPTTPSGLLTAEEDRVTAGVLLFGEDAARAFSALVCPLSIVRMVGRQRY